MVAGKVCYILSNAFMVSYFCFLTLSIRNYTTWGRNDPEEAVIYCGLASLLAYFLLMDRIFGICVWILTSSPGHKYNSLLAFTRLTVLILAARDVAALVSTDKPYFQVSFFLLIMSFTTYAAWKAPDERGRNIPKLVGAGCGGTALSLLNPIDFQPRGALFFFLSSIFCLGCNIFHPSYNQAGNRIGGIRDFLLDALRIDNFIGADERPEVEQPNQNVHENVQNQLTNEAIQDQQVNQGVLVNMQNQPPNEAGRLGSTTNQDVPVQNQLTN